MAVPLLWSWDMGLVGWLFHPHLTFFRMRITYDSNKLDVIPLCLDLKKYDVIIFLLEMNLSIEVIIYETSRSIYHLGNLMKSLSKEV